jgi:GT2 family glycosyltransferase
MPRKRKLNLTIVMIGMDGWTEWTKPAINSIRDRMPDTPIIVVDHGRKPYPAYLDVQFIRLPEPVSYARAINLGVAESVTDWTMIINNDVLAYEPLDVSKLDPAFIYAKRILSEKGVTWADSWLVLAHRQVWDVVGPWDENFLMCGFEDADWCIRAHELGVDIQPLQWNVKHFWGKTRWQLPGYKEQRLRNIAYLEQKHGVRLGENVKAIYG